MAAADPKHQGRTLILCFDGSGDSYDDDNTNIVRLFTALDKTKPDQQLCYYQPGIGTYVSPAAAWSPTLKKISKGIDHAIAWYLDTHIMGGYRFLMDNYRIGDRICMFGFSRGAYTARCLAGMLHKVGLLPKSNEEQISFAYEKYIDTSPGFHTRAAGFKAAFSIPVDIEFLGVWDTVSSVGINGRHLPFCSSNTMIRTFRHALSLDERRAKFQPNPWHKPAPTKEAAKYDPECATAVYDETGINRLEAAQKWYDEVSAGGVNGGTANGTAQGTAEAVVIPQQSQGPGGSRPKADDEDVEDVYWNGKETDVKEVWFPGCHKDVGGGSVPNGTPIDIANITLCWMLTEIIKAEATIIFKPGAFSDIPAFQLIASPPLALPNPPLTVGVAPTSKGRPSNISEATFVESAERGSGSKRKAEASWTSTSHTRDLETATIGNSTIVSVREAALVKDSASKLHDKLAGLSIWWLLELVPEPYALQHSNGRWAKGWFINIGRGRWIQEPNPKFHSSVKLRMEQDPAYKPAARYTGTVEYVD